jgi:hypothetical protein
MVMDIDSYDVLLGLDFLIKIGAIVDVERGLIQVRKGPGVDVEVLPLTMVNLLQRVNSGSQIQDTPSIRKRMHNDGDANWTSDHDHAIMTKKDGSSTSTSYEDIDDSERSDPESNQLQQIDCENEFGDVELEELVKSEGPQEILRLTIQEQADDFMKEEITDSDDYADWIQWVSDAEQRKQVISITSKHDEAPILL